MKIKHFLLSLILLVSLILVLKDIPRDAPQHEAVATSHETAATLHEAAENGYFKTVKTLIAEGANVNPKDTGGRTPLSIARSFEHTEIIRILIDAGGL